VPVTRGPLYFTRLAAAVADQKVVRAFYEFFLERDTTSFHPEKTDKDSATLVTQRSFNLKTLGGGYFAIFLRTHLEYAERVWSKRDSHFNLTVRYTLSVPYAALRAAWLAFSAEIIPQAYGSKLKFQAELNRTTTVSVSMDEFGQRVHYVTVDKIPVTTFRAGSPKVRAVHFGVKESGLTVRVSMSTMNGHLDFVRRSTIATAVGGEQIRRVVFEAR